MSGCSCTCAHTINRFATADEFKTLLHSACKVMEVRPHVSDFKTEGLQVRSLVPRASIVITRDSERGYGLKLTGDQRAGVVARAGDVIGMVTGNVALDGRGPDSPSTVYDWDLGPRNAGAPRAYIRGDESCTALSLLNEQEERGRHNCAAVSMAGHVHMLIVACKDISNGEALVLSYTRDGVHTPSEVVFAELRGGGEVMGTDGAVHDQMTGDARGVQPGDRVEDVFAPGTPVNVALNALHLNPAGVIPMRLLCPASEFAESHMSCVYAVREQDADGDDDTHPTGMVYVPELGTLYHRTLWGSVVAVHSTAGAMQASQRDRLYINWNVWRAGQTMMQLSLSEVPPWRAPQ